MDKRLHIRMKKRIRMQSDETITLRDLAFIEGPTRDKELLEELNIHRISKVDGEFIVIEAFLLLAIIRKHLQDYEVEFMGPEETIVEIAKREYQPSLLFVMIVWVVLFIGTAMSIMNFHYDVSMPEVHQKLHYMFTGEKVLRPLWIQIPYSIGLGVGMILFLNHWFKKRLNEEPSPLEIELFNYERNLEAYIRHYENELNNDERHF
ncbi:MAG TPA: stage V sporulation protein AA [Pseudogracilibacillus sp.]|nr:stage V sporulation protein AA [Pseudogracilibacillus sp.]